MRNFNSFSENGLKRVAIDLTPLMPGGENGGVKVFVRELLPKMFSIHPQTFFVLLTRTSSHDELSYLDSKNVVRKVALVDNTTSGFRKYPNKIFDLFLRYMPRRTHRVVYYLKRKVGSFLNRGLNKGMLQQLGADLLFCPFTTAQFHEPGIPLVCVIHDLQHKTYPQFFSLEELRHREYTYNEVFRKATALAAVSDYSAKTAMKHGGINECSIRTIHHRFASRISIDRNYIASIIHTLQLEPGKYFIYPANFWQHKNHEMLFVAFSIAQANGLKEGFKLVCTGAPDSRRDYLNDMVNGMGLHNRVVFPGYLTEEELSQILIHSTALVFPSLYEGFGLPVLEAMAAGVPVACSNRTSLPEVAGDAAVLFDPRVPKDVANAMLEIAGNLTLRNKLIVEGKKRAISFNDPGRMESEYWELFNHALLNKKEDNVIRGVYEDGWVGGNFSIHLPVHDSQRSIKIELYLPDYVPIKNSTITVLRNNKSLKKFDIYPGQNLSVNLTARGMDHSFEFYMSNVFIPSKEKMGDDNRELALKIIQCLIVPDKQEPIQLFPDPLL